MSTNPIYYPPPPPNEAMPRWMIYLALFLAGGCFWVALITGAQIVAAIIPG